MKKATITDLIADLQQVASGSNPKLPFQLHELIWLIQTHIGLGKMSTMLRQYRDERFADT